MNVGLCQLLWRSFICGLNAVFTEVLPLYPGSGDTGMELLGMQAEMAPRGAPTPPFSEVGDWNRRARRGWELMPFIPKVKACSCFTLSVSWACLFWSVWFVYKHNRHGALENCTVGSVHLLSSLSQFQRKYQKSEIWTPKSSLTAWHPPQLLQPPTRFASQTMSGASEATQNPWYWISQPVRILKCPRAEVRACDIRGHKWRGRLAWIPV